MEYLASTSFTEKCHGCYAKAKEQRISKLLCRLIAELVGTDKRVLKEILNRMEQASGEPGIDLRMTSEIYGTLHMKMRSLGLDPNDTTPHELYRALMNLTALHDKFIADKIGITDYRNPEAILPAVVQMVNNCLLYTSPSPRDS